MPPRTEPVFFTGRDGNRLAGDVAGPEDGPTVVFFHGGGQTRHSWDGSLSLMATRGWRAYTVDMRGHGESDWAADGDYTLDAFAGDVRQVALSLDRRPALVGASLGGLASLAAAAGYPSVDPPGETVATALVMVDVAPRMEERGRERIGEFMMEHLESGFASLEEVADAIARYNPHRPRPKDLSGLKKNLRQRDGRWYWHWDPSFVLGVRGSPDETRAAMIDPEKLEQVAAHLSVPLLLVRGLVSDLLSEEGAQAFLKLVPRAEFVHVAGAGHMVAGDRNDVFNEAVVSFLAKTLPGPFQ